MIIKPYPVSAYMLKLFLPCVCFILGIFQPDVRHLVVLATPVDIVILGLSYSNLQTGMATYITFFQICWPIDTTIKS